MKITKIIGLTATVISGVASLMKEWKTSKELDSKIEKKVAEALAKKLTE